MANSRTFLIHWAADDAERVAQELRSIGCEVRVETEDGGRACKLISEDPPDLVVIDLSRRPSHGLQTARGLKGVKATRRIPIYFLDGSRESVEKAKVAFPNDRHVSSSRLEDGLSLHKDIEGKPLGS